MKNILPVLLLSCTIAFNSCGQTREKATEKKPAEQQTLPPADLPARNWVLDEDSLFTATQAAELNRIIREHEQETGNEIAIVTLRPAPQFLQEAGGLDSFSRKFFNARGIGKKDKNNGLGLLIVRSERSVRIEVGTGLEVKLTDAEAQTIIDSVLVPSFRQQEWYRGVSQALEAMIRQIK